LFPYTTLFRSYNISGTFKLCFFPGTAIYFWLLDSRSWRCCSSICGGVHLQSLSSFGILTVTPQMDFNSLGNDSFWVNSLCWSRFDKYSWAHVLGTYSSHLRTADA